MIDILFVHPNASDIIYQDLSKRASAIEPPIWAGMLANYVRLKKYNPKILDCEAENLDYKSSAKKILEIKAKIICFVVYGQQPSASAQNMEGATEVADIIKDLEPTSKILFVGGYVAALPKKTLEDEKSIDFICTNEGVYTIGDLLQIEKFNYQNLKKIKGLGFRDEDGNVLINEASSIVSRENLEHDLPGMAWDLLPGFDKYRTSGWHSWSNKSNTGPFAALYTSLGCPYKCSFCMINIINRSNNNENITSKDSNIFRWWNPDFIIKQFDYFAQNNVKNIKIADELFVLNPRHFLKICELIIERGYNFNIWAYSRIDTCKPKFLETLKKAGVVWLGLGIENPNNIIRKEVHKDAFKEIRILDTIREMQSFGINVAANYIFGLPKDNYESMKFTLDFALEAKSEMANFYCAMAYPGSPLYLESLSKGIKLPETYSGYSQHSYYTQNIPSDYLEAKEILKFRDYAWSVYHKDENYLNLLEYKFGKHSRLNLEETSKIKLKRKLLETN
jgi:anaerobic magnesium-protoporphyrin IX monomethyl ester cyclase